MPLRLCFAVIGLAAILQAADQWSKEAAARYLDERQKEWFAWPAAKVGGAPCVSCHTGMTYLLARPLLRTGNAQPTEYEAGLRKSLAGRIATAQDASEDVGVESVMTVLFLPEDEAGWERLWKLQIADGPKTGAFPWYSLELDPYEMPESAYFGASLAAIAVAQKSPEWRSAPSRKSHIDRLIGFLRRDFANQPLHNKLAAVWASSQLKGILTQDQTRETVAAVWKAQQPDGGWSIAGLGPWQTHAAAPARATGSDAYATAWAAAVLRTSGEDGRRLNKARRWLAEHQDRESGAWRSVSMNKSFKPGSMMERFMDDAATGFAVMALR